MNGGNSIGIRACCRILTKRITIKHSASRSMIPGPDDSGDATVKLDPVWKLKNQLPSEMRLIGRKASGAFCNCYCRVVDYAG